jgi:Holliday junction resolvase RusA-like endonuclease
MSQFRVVVHGEPVAKGRPQFSVHGGRAFARTPAKTRRYEDIIRQSAIQAWNGAPVLKDVALTVRAVFVRSIPASWSRRKREAAVLGEVRPISRPDSDNLFKAVTDGLNGVIYHDDAQIVEQTCAKFYGIEPRVEITVSWVAP